MTNDANKQKNVSAPSNQKAQSPVTFSQLAGGKNELTIEHEGQLYRLLATKNGKLLLNK